MFARSSVSFAFCSAISALVFRISLLLGSYEHKPVPRKYFLTQILSLQLQDSELERQQIRSYMNCFIGVYGASFSAVNFPKVNDMKPSIFLIDYFEGWCLYIFRFRYMGTEEDKHGDPEVLAIFGDFGKISLIGGLGDYIYCEKWYFFPIFE